MTFDGGRALDRDFNLTGDGSYARNLFIVLICARPPRRVFISGSRAILHRPATCPLKPAPASAKKPWLAGYPAGSFSGSSILKAPVAQLDRALPSEGRGHRFESCRVRQ